MGLRNIALGLAAAIFLVVCVGLVWIANKNREIQAQRDELQAKKTKLEETIAALDAANGQLEEKTDELGQEKTKLESTNTLLRQAKADADVQTQTARKAQEDEAGASYLAQIGVAAERIANNSYLDAARLLADYDADRSPWTFFRHWEWGHLKRLCDLQSGQKQVGPRIEAFVQSADAKLLAAGTAAGKVYVWGVDWPRAALTQVAVLAHRGPVRTLALSPQGDRLALAGDFENGAIFVYERVAGGKDFLPAPKRLSGHPAGVLALEFSPQRDLLVSSSRDGLTRLWKIASGEAVQTFPGHSGPVWSAVFSSDGEQIATAGDDATVQIYRVGEARPRIYRGHDGPVYAVAWSPQGSWIASAGRDRAVHVWRADKSLQIDYQGIAKELTRELREAPGAIAPRTAFHQPEFALAGHSAEIHSLAFSQDGVYVVSGANDNTVRRWNIQHPEQVTTFRGHGGWIRGCVLGADPRYAASGSLDGFVKIWNAQEYEEVRTLRGHGDAVLWAAYSRDGSRIVTAGRDRQALVWSIGSREPVLVLDEGEPTAASDTSGLSAKLKEGHDYLVTKAAFFPDQKRILTSAGDGSVRIWDLTSGGQLRRLTHTGTQGVLALSPDGRWILTGSDSRGANQQQGALLWDANQADAQPTFLAGHPAEVSAVAFSSGKDQATPSIATGDIVGNVRLWRFESASRTWVPSSRLAGHAAGYPITDIAFTPDGKRVLTAAQDRTVLLHDVVSGQLLPLTLRHQGGVKAMQLSRNGGMAITLCSLSKGAYRVSAWDLASGAERACDVSLPNEPLTSIAFLPDQASALLTSTTGNESRFWKWDLASPALTPLWPSPVKGTVWSAVYSPDGSKLLAVGGSRARLLTAAQGELEKTFSPHGPLTAADFSPSGKLIATSSLDGDVKIWNTDPQHPQYGRVTFKIPQAHGSERGPASVNSVVFSPLESEGQFALATAGNDGTAQIWTIEGSEVSRSHSLAGHNSRVRTATFSPDGKLVLTASEDKTARLWDAATGQPTGPGGGVMGHPEAVLFAAFSPDGTLAITGCDDNNAYIWDLSGSAVMEPKLLQGHTAAVTSAAVSPDNRRAITGSQDGIAKLWDLSSGKEILSLKRHTAELTSVHFAPDGSSLLTSSLDRTALLWQAAKIGPSLKLSSAQLEIPRTAGTHPIDSLAQILDPDAADLAGGTLRAWLQTAPQAKDVGLAVAGGGLEVVQNQVVLVAGEERRPLAELQGGQSPMQFELRLLPSVQARDAQRLLRSIALRVNQPLAQAVTVNFQLVDAAGLASNLAEATVQSEEAATQRREIAAARPK